MEPDIGLAKKARADVADALAQVLADNYALYQKTHSYHWNVTGGRFRELHLMFEEQYNALWTATDELAERIRALGVLAPSLASMSKKSVIVADNGDASAEQMVLNLMKGHEALAKSCHGAREKADEADDQVTVDLMNARAAYSEKTAWMLRATAEG
jgi:starvation-inducible DNA-binding protein